MQQNEILDVFFDDWAALTIDDGSFGSKADNHLKVCTNYYVTVLNLLLIYFWLFKNVSDFQYCLSHLKTLLSVNI